jgi:phosphoribosylformylglycinamidine synthase
MEQEKRVQAAIREVVNAGLAESAHDLSDGGLAVALSECCTGEIGARVNITPAERIDFALFGEAPSRILLTSQSPDRIREIALRFDVECPVIGVTMKERLQIGSRTGVSPLCDGFEDRDETNMWIDVATTDLKQAFENSLPQLLHTV